MIEDRDIDRQTDKQICRGNIFNELENQTKEV